MKEPSDWVSSLVVVKKTNEDLRICRNHSDLNKAMKRSHYPLPTFEQIIPKLRNAKIFSLIDAKDGFWQVKLTKNSSFMPFGISSAPEEFDGVCVKNLMGWKASRS